MRLIDWLLRRRQDEDLDDEIRAHLSMAEHDLRDEGLDARSARLSARRSFGNVTLTREATRQTWGSAWRDTVGDFLQDIRYAIRTLVKMPGFTLAAVLALALGVGANTAIFSVVNAVVLRPFPYPAPEQLVMMTERGPQMDSMSVALPNYVDWRAENRVFAEMGVFRRESFNLSGVDQPERLFGRMVTASILPMLGVKPSIGRQFLPDEDRPGGPPVE